PVDGLVGELLLARDLLARDARDLDRHPIEDGREERRGDLILGLQRHLRLDERLGDRRSARRPLALDTVREQVDGDPEGFTADGGNEDQSGGGEGETEKSHDRERGDFAAAALEARDLNHCRSSFFYREQAWPEYRRGGPRSLGVVSDASYPNTRC